MNTLFYNYVTNHNQFKVDYPYYGLFGTAQVKLVQEQNDKIFECKINNGTVVRLKKMKEAKKWIDLEMNEVTPLSSIIGGSIDDFLKEAV